MFGSLHGYELVFLFIAAAAVFDFCDGAAARLLRSYSSIGKELDSLSDLVSFGLAPALLVFNTMEVMDGCQWLPFVALFIAVCGALRLAKFNVDDRQTSSFIGLPIPANALFWIGWCAWTHETGLYDQWCTLALIVALSLLMVSNLRMFSLKFKNFKFRENIKRYFILLAAAILIAVLGIPGIAWAILLYVIIAIVSPTRSTAVD